MGQRSCLKGIPKWTNEKLLVSLPWRQPHSRSLLHIGAEQQRSPCSLSALTCLPHVHDTATAAALSPQRLPRCHRRVPGTGGRQGWAGHGSHRPRVWPVSSAEPRLGQRLVLPQGIPGMKPGSCRSSSWAPDAALRSVLPASEFQAVGNEVAGWPGQRGC